MTTEIRVLDGEHDLIAAANLFRTAMVGFPPLPSLAPGQITTLLEPGRTLGAFVDGQLVGTADAVTSGLTLPGGAVVGHAAVTHIGVLPSFTRKGIATELIHHQLRDIDARGEVVATLRASEATIYERYGYGVAGSTQTVEVQTARAALRPDVGTGGAVRLIDAAQAWEVLPRIYADNRSSRPGTIDRPTAAHRIRLAGFVCRGAWRAGIRNGLRPLPSRRHRDMVRQRTAHHRSRGFLRTQR
jgi:GNAT superfamily N-acetyltransferase